MEVGFRLFRPRYKIYYTEPGQVNRQGFCDTRDFATIDYLSGRTRVMMEGDSFLFGIWLDAQDAIPAILGRKSPDCEFYNLGIPSWGARSATFLTRSI